MITTSGKNKATIHRIYGAFGRFDEIYNYPADKFAEALKDPDVSCAVWDIIDACYAPDVKGHDPAAVDYSSGTDELKTLLKLYHNAFPGHTYDVQQMVAEGDMVAYRWTVEGVHKGELFGVAPTGKTITVEGFSICKFNDEGKVVEVWQQWDRQGLMEQLEAKGAGTVRV